MGPYQIPNSWHANSKFSAGSKVIATLFGGKNKPWVPSEFLNSLAMITGVNKSTIYSEQWMKKLGRNSGGFLPPENIVLTFEPTEILGEEKEFDFGTNYFFNWLINA